MPAEAAAAAAAWQTRTATKKEAAAGDSAGMVTRLSLSALLNKYKWPHQQPDVPIGDVGEAHRENMYFIETKARCPHPLFG